MELDPTERMNPMSTLPPSSPRTRRESFADVLTVRVDEQGNGRPMLLLHVCALGGGRSQADHRLRSTTSMQKDHATTVPLLIDAYGESVDERLSWRSRRISGKSTDKL